MNEKIKLSLILRKKNIFICTALDIISGIVPWNLLDKTKIRLEL
jgi:hypothetical protein